MIKDSTKIGLLFCLAMLLIFTMTLLMSFQIKREIKKDNIHDFFNNGLICSTQGEDTKDLFVDSKDWTIHGKWFVNNNSKLSVKIMNCSSID